MEEKLSTQYNEAVQQIKTAILRSQAKALAGVNQEQLALYYGIGRYISQNTRQGVWGKDAIATISRQLSAELPGLRGFSATNLRLMRIFYEEWKSLEANPALSRPAVVGRGYSTSHCRERIRPPRADGQQLQPHPACHRGGGRDADRTFVEYVLQEYQRPMGVATYRTSQEQLRELLPDEEEMKRLMQKKADTPNPTA